MLTKTVRNVGKESVLYLDSSLYLKVPTGVEKEPNLLISDTN